MTVTPSNVERILVFGNSGSGKTTMAHALSDRSGLAHLDLDLVAWDSPGVRRSIDASAAEIHAFRRKQPGWVIEGSYGDLIELLLPSCTELRFLNPGVEACIGNCRRRPWEPEKYATRADQDAMLDFLISWIREYESRTDEFSLVRHRQIFDRFAGPKREYGAGDLVTAEVVGER